MATKRATMPDVPMAIVDGRHLLPLEDAMQLLRLLVKAQPVTRAYEQGGYVYKFSTAQEFSMAPLTVAQEAALNLSSDS